MSDDLLTEGAGTRSRMVRATAELMQRRGWHGAGVAEILALAKAPRGSLYHHFPGGKAQLGLEGVRFTARVFARQLAEAGQNAADLDAYLNALAQLSGRDLLASGFEAACPVAATALDVPQDELAIIAACSDAFALWHNTIASSLEPLLSHPDRAHMLARVATSSLLGATVLARVGRNTSTIDDLAADLRAIAIAIDR